MESFDQQKRQVMGKLVGDDRSPKGSLDAPIVDLIHFLNAHADFVTTSSCSGRIAVLRASEDGDAKGVEWLLVEHATITYEQLHKALHPEESTVTGRVTFKHEPFIMHVQCRDVQAAKWLLQLKIGFGYK